MFRPLASRVLLVTFAILAPSCAVLRDKPSGAPPMSDLPPLPVEKASEEIVLAAWAEPSRLPQAGGQAQIVVRLQKRGGAPYPGVQVRLRTTTGTLFSGGRVLVTDSAGRTRDRLTTRQNARITLNAGGTVYRFTVAVGPPPTD